MSAEAVLPSGPGPPSYAEAWEAGKLHGVVCVDFPPKCIDDGGILTSAKYERFDLLVARANAWLKQHPQLCVTNLETVEYKTKNIKYGATVDTKVSLKMEEQQSGFMAVSTLRVWVGPGDSHGGFKTGDQVGYLNVVPACLHPGGVLTSPRFDTIHTTLDKLNSLLRHRPIPGVLLNVETVQSMRLRQYSTKWIAPDRCHWREHVDVPLSRLVFLRLYYRVQAAPHAHWDIGFQDIAPTVAEMSSSRRGTGSSYESHSAVMDRVRGWIAQSPHTHVLGVETIQSKLSKSTQVIAHHTKSLMTTFKPTDRIYFKRVWYTKRPEESAIEDPIPLQLHAKLFCPVVSPGGFCNAARFENMTVLKRRLVEWQDQNPAFHVVYVETSSTGMEMCPQKPTPSSPSPSSSLTNDMPMYLSRDEALSALRILIAYYIHV